MSEKAMSIERVTDIVAKDLEFIEYHLDNDPDGFWARTLIKTVCSYVESEVYLLKQGVLKFCNEGSIDIPPEVKLFLNNKKFELGNNGKLNERLLQGRVRDEVKFIFSQICTLKGYEQLVGFDSDGWEKLISTIEVRNRLTHPKSTDDLSVTDKEVEESGDAFTWFMDNVIDFIQKDRVVLEQKLEELKNKQKPLANLRAGSADVCDS